MQSESETVSAGFRLCAQRGDSRRSQGWLPVYSLALADDSRIRLVHEFLRAGRRCICLLHIMRVILLPTSDFIPKSSFSRRSHALSLPRTISVHMSRMLLRSGSSTNWIATGLFRVTYSPTCLTTMVDLKKSRSEAMSSGIPTEEASVSSRNAIIFHTDRSTGDTPSSDPIEAALEIICT